MINNIKIFTESIGYKLISTNYITAKSKLNFICDCGHEFSMNWNNFKSGQRCPECNGGVKYSIKKVSEYINETGFRLHSKTYDNAKQKLLIECPNGHHFKKCFNKFQQGQRCPYCSVQSSKPEKEVFHFVKTIYSGEVINNDKRTIYNYFTNRFLELDIYLPHIHKAIEFNGYYHTTTDIIKWRDEIKKKRCLYLGIDLMIILNEDWLHENISTRQKITKFLSN
jgi:hypothetical protein